MRAEQINELLKTEKTPLFVFDRKELKHRVVFFRKNLPEGVKLGYAVKAIPFLAKKWAACSIGWSFAHRVNTEYAKSWTFPYQSL